MHSEIRNLLSLARWLNSRRSARVTPWDQSIDSSTLTTNAGRARGPTGESPQRRRTCGGARHRTGGTYCEHRGRPPRSAHPDPAGPQQVRRPVPPPVQRQRRTGRRTRQGTATEPACARQSRNLRGGVGAGERRAGQGRAAIGSGVEGATIGRCASGTIGRCARVRGARGPATPQRDDGHPAAGEVQRPDQEGRVVDRSRQASPGPPRCPLTVARPDRRIQCFGPHGVRGAVLRSWRRR